MNRRGFMRNLGLGAFVGAVPIGVAAIEPKSNVVKPVLMERTCDSGKTEMGQEAWDEMMANYRLEDYKPFLGCGTRFQWYWGVNCICPTCGWHYVCGMKQKELFEVK